VEKAVEKAKQRVDRMLKTARPIGKNKILPNIFFSESFTSDRKSRFRTAAVAAIILIVVPA
jgi:hypothetical protein